jgi:hypothetical protein
MLTVRSASLPLTWHFTMPAQCRRLSLPGSAFPVPKASAICWLAASACPSMQCA